MVIVERITGTRPPQAEGMCGNLFERAPDFYYGSVGDKEYGLMAQIMAPLAERIYIRYGCRTAAET